MVGQLREHFGVHLALVEFFEQPTARGLAALLFSRRLAELVGLVDSLSDEEVAAQLAPLGDLGSLGGSEA